MRISLLVAMDENRGIGIENRLPWHLSTDLKRFKTLTMGHCLVMGRKTYETIGRPLAGRTMIVTTRNHAYQAKGCLIARSVDDALALSESIGESEVFIIGGGDIFSQTIGRADRIYITLVHASLVTDTYFPEIDATEWRELESSDHPAGDEDQYPHTFRILERFARS
jgi:dihydrofolate reductase